MIAPGERYGRLEVVGEAARDGAGRRYLCRCDCGRETVVRAGNLTSGNTRSCGCLAAERRAMTGRANLEHGHHAGGKPSPTYRSWRAMIARCKPNHVARRYYYDQGVRVADEWQGPGGFARFLAHMGERPPGTTLDRWPDNTGDYRPFNCRWATRSEQRRNQRRRERASDGRLREQLDGGSS